jgi:Holliday junction resolvase
VVVRVTNSSKARGSAWERDLVKYLREQDIDTERLALRGARDEGDIVMRDASGRGGRYILEAKATARIDLAGWVGQAEVEALNYATHRGIGMPGFVVAYKRRQHPVGKSYIITTLDEWLRQIA